MTNVKEANQYTNELHRLAKKNIFEEQKLQHYEAAIAEKTPSDQSKLKAIYEEVGVVFADSIKHTLEEAKKFHEQITRNRVAFLKVEIVRLKNDIKERNKLIKTFTEIED